MKSVFARRLLIATFLAASVTAIAQDATINALGKLQNVIANNVPSQYRGDLLDKAADVDQASADLTRSLKKLDNVVNNSLPKEQRELVNAKISAVKAAIAQDLIGGGIQAGGEKQYFCVQACRTLGGYPSESSRAGAFGHSQLEAKAAAAKAITTKFDCNYGSVQAGCEEVVGNQNVTCAAGCSTLGGYLSGESWTTGNGRTKEEAYINAMANVKSQFECNYGQVRGECE